MLNDAFRKGVNNNSKNYITAMNNYTLNDTRATFIMHKLQRNKTLDRNTLIMGDFHMPHSA